MKWNSVASEARKTHGLNDCSAISVLCEGVSCPYVWRLREALPAQFGDDEGDIGNGGADVSVTRDFAKQLTLRANPTSSHHRGLGASKEVLLDSRCEPSVDAPRQPD